MGRKGQASVEFLIMFSASLMLFLISISIAFMHLTEARMVEDALDATALCLRVSSTISSFVALGDGSAYTFDLPVVPGLNYTVWVNSEHGLVKLNYDDRGVGCRLQTMNITDSGGNGFFELARNATIVNEGGMIVVEQ